LKKGEIWLVDLTRGAEMKKTRPHIILNNGKIGELPLKIVAPITDIKEHYHMVPWMAGLEPDTDNGLKKPSAIDLFRVCSIFGGETCQKDRPYRRQGDRILQRGSGGGVRVTQVTITPGLV
jgi:mRNA interferase MazF